MSQFTLHNIDTAPEASRAILAETAKRFGFLPNLLGYMAESPAALSAYTMLHQLLSTKSGFSPAEVQLLALIVSFENGCDYCLAAHGWRAASIGVSDATIAALKSGGALPDPRHNALADFARSVVRDRGWVDDRAVEAFLAAGFTRGQVFDLLVAVAWKTLSNYVNHLAKTEVDDGFKTASGGKA